MKTISEQKNNAALKRVRTSLRNRNTDLRYKHWGLRHKLNFLRDIKADVIFYKNNFGELARKYESLLDFAQQKMVNNGLQKPDSVEDFFVIIKTLRKEYHNNISILKAKRRKVLNKLSTIPKKIKSDL